MAKTILLHITTPEKDFFAGTVESVVLTSTEGELGVLPSHLPMVVGLTAGALRFRIGEQWRIAAVSGGFARILGGEVMVFADTAEWPEEIELNRVLEAKKRAEERLQNRASEIEYVRSRVALDRALMRLQIKQGEGKFL